MDAGLPFGRFKWSVVSTWDGGSDQIGEVDARARLLAVPDCFGAAARDPAHPCTNPALAKVVTPTPAQALLMPNAPCAPYEPKGLVYPCYFGVAPDHARATVALLGDSHAEHWRAAIEVVAQSKRWRGISLSRSGCPYNSAGAKLRTDRDSDECHRWQSQIRSFLAEHKEVHTVFVAARASADFARDPAEGAREALRSLPKSVRRIYVLRATPETFGPEAGCVTRKPARQADDRHLLRAPTRRQAPPRPADPGRGRPRQGPRLHEVPVRRDEVPVGHRRRARPQGRLPPHAHLRADTRPVRPARDRLIVEFRSARSRPGAPRADAIVWIASH